jgi:DNA-binding LacI/PurR family transcriptional regulator
MNLEISKNRFNGYKDALLKHGLPFVPELTRICDTRRGAEMITPQMFDGDTYPDAFFAINDETAIGILYTVKHMGLRVPEDVSICGFTNDDRATSSDPMLTTVEQRGIQVGEEAADILIGHVEGTIPLNHAERRIVRTRLILRGTTR